MDIENLKLQVNNLIDQWYKGEQSAPNPDNKDVDVAEARVLPEGKRVVRTKGSGDRVYFIDEAKNTRQWVTNPEVLKSTGFEIGDVVEVDDNELLKYTMAPALYRVDA